MMLIGVAGGSGSGKTTFAKKILQRLDTNNVGILHQDSYYLPSLPEHLKSNGKLNFDHADAFDWPLLREHLSRLKRGESVDVPVYNYEQNRRTGEVERLGPCQALVVEGIFMLWDAEIRNLFDVKAFLHVEADIRFIRRLHRDVQERGRTLDSVVQQYYDTVRPMHHRFIESTRQYANIVVGEETDIAADVIAARIEQKITSLKPIVEAVIKESLNV
jgi:uridine kinase